MRFHKSSLVALAMAVLPMATIAILPVGAHAQTVAAPSSAQMATAVQIITNLHLYDLLAFGGRAGILQIEAVAALSSDDQKRVVAMFDDEMATRRADTVRAMALGNVGLYTADQLNQLLALSKIKYVQDLVLAGGDESLATPDEASMTDAERTLFVSMMNEPWVTDFFAKFDYSTATPSIGAAAQAALGRFGIAVPAS